MNEATETKKVPFCSKDWDEDGVITFTFGNGEVVSLNVRALSEEQQYNLMMHGAGQKIGDSYASAKGDYTIAVAAAQKVCDQLVDDQWTASRASAGEGAPKTGELAQAIANLKKLPLNDVAAAVAKATDEQRKAWRKNAAIAAEIARLRAEKAAERASKAGDTGTADDIDLG